MNSPSLKLYRAYSISFNSSNLAIFLELNSEGLYQSSGKEKESCCLVFPPSTKRGIRHFHVVVAQQRRQRNVQKKRDARAKLFSCQSKPIAFLPFSVPSLLSLLPNMDTKGTCLSAVLPGCPNYRTYWKAFAVRVRFLLVRSSHR